MATAPPPSPSGTVGATLDRAGERALREEVWTAVSRLRGSANC